MFPGIPIGGFELSTWRVLVLGAVLLCWALFLKRSKSLGYPAGPVLVFLALELLVGTLGGHLFNLLIPAVFGAPASPAGGLTVIGSIVSTLAFAQVYLKRVLKTPPLPFLDAVAFTMPLTMSIGRLGCLLNGCCYGRFAPDWAGESLSRLFTIPAGLYSPSSAAGAVLEHVPGDRLLWNLPLMLALNSLCVLLVTETLYRNRRRWDLLPGTVLAAAVAQETGGRFLLEFLRWDDVVAGTPFNPWQLSLLLIFLAAVTALGRSSPVREREGLLKRALLLEYLTVGWNVVEAIIGIGAGLAANSVALLGFGIDSVVESASGGVLIWRLKEEEAGMDREAVESLDRRAHKLVAGSLFALAVYVALDAARALWTQDRPEASLVGIGLTGVSMMAMAWLARAKRRAAVLLKSRALEADSFQTSACWGLSAAALAGIGLNAAFGWWWADPVAALGMAALILREAREGWRGEGGCCGAG
jgi:prolipoprotein diacylglyceryltransferase